ncbi:hypothetical protein PATSB16_33790 [Pandoraea thiooxydans]|nr:hypothetical protein PATSB16_33790 [Pandoraea thiooxydans]
MPAGTSLSPQPGCPCESARRLRQLAILTIQDDGQGARKRRHGCSLERNLT